MKLWEVTNGYYEECFVVAETKERALELAGAKFKEDWKIIGFTQQECCEDLNVEFMCNCDKEWVSETSDY